MTYEIVPARLEHVRMMARTMRPLDRAEIEGFGLCVRHTLHWLWRDSPMRRAALVDGEVAAIWGYQGALMSDEVVPWLFTAPAIERAKLAFYREARREIDEMLALHGRLHCHVLAAYKQSVRFFEVMGFKIDAGEPIGRDGTLYRLMTLERPHPDRHPFIVYGLPRSRTAWLSSFLSYGDFVCHHEAAITMRCVSDIVSFFNRPRTGTCETAAAQGWKLLHHHVPDIRAVVVRRPVDEVVAAILAMDTRGAVIYDERMLRRNMEYGARMLDKISAHPGVLAVDYADLDDPGACAAIFEHCLSEPFDATWWKSLKDQNIQVDPVENLRYYHSNRDSVDGFKRACRSEINRLARARLI